ncbi:MAG: DNA-directed DNA polymerase [Candidatus Kapaibacterium sp.]|nr:MAG: DNA-directed DNA polymerase [Candidatus Kapabacteria bacterium]
MSDFVHLHNHSHYSLLDAIATPDQLVAAAAADGQPAVALTDHGVMFGCMEFLFAAKKRGIKPIIGCEMYLATGSRFDRTPTDRNTNTRNYHHLVLLAKNETGYRNLCKLVSLAHTEGYYYKPRIDRELLAQYHEGLIALSACLAGPVNAPLIRGDFQTAYDTARWFKDIFGGDWYIELQHHGLPEDAIVLEHAPRIARELGIEMVATNDCHYIAPSHAIAHNVHLLIKDATASTAGTFDITELRYRVPGFYFKTADEMKALFRDFPRAIENTLAIAEKISFEPSFAPKMPVFPIPEDSSANTLDEYLEELAFRGLERRYSTITEDIRERLTFELSVIKRMGYSGYFLIVQDFIAAARKRGISVGPGRGSAAGSLVAYALGITNIDPLKHDLLFERFLNPDRVSLPDIDVDFNDERRDEVIEYVRDKYGADAVAQIITFGTLSARQVIKDVGRVLGISPSTISAITEKIPVVLGKVTKLSEALNLPELRWLRDSDDPKLQQLVEYALVLEGLARNTSVHAAGVVIAPGPITDYVPIYKTPSTNPTTQYTMKELEAVGLLKMDFLGLATLSIIDRTLEQIKANYGITIDIDAIDFNDQQVYDMLGQGHTLAVFQFESEKMTEYLCQLKPRNLEELTAMNALYRPGPMDNIPEFIDRKFGRKPIEYLHPLMERRLKNTYGIIVYQEQVMQLVQDLAGFTLAQADTLRRAMGKKDDKLMAQQRQAFIEGAQRTNGIEPTLAGEIFDLIQKFASYGFNKSHSAAYAYLAYQTAWLKCHYTAEFLAANMTAELGKLDKINALIAEAKKFGITVLPPHVNQSNTTFRATSPTTIVFGLAAIKNVGIPAVESIIKAREEGGPFRSLFDFCKRIDTRLVNKRALEALIASGALDGLGGHRAQLMAALDSALDFAKSAAASVTKGIESLFGSDTMGLVEPSLPEIEPWSKEELLRHEHQVLNFFISGHPLDNHAHLVRAMATIHLGRVESASSGNTVRCCGLVTNVSTRLDKSERTFAIATIEDYTGTGELILWSSTYEQYSNLLEDGTIIVAMGKLDLRDDSAQQPRIIVEQLFSLEQAYAQIKTIHIRIDVNTPAPKLDQLAALSDKTATTVDIVFTLLVKSEPRKRFLLPKFRLRLTRETIQHLIDLFGAENIRLSITEL